MISIFLTLVSGGDDNDDDDERQRVERRVWNEFRDRRQFGHRYGQSRKKNSREQAGDQVSGLFPFRVSLENRLGDSRLTERSTVTDTVLSGNSDLLRALSLRRGGKKKKKGGNKAKKCQQFVFPTDRRRLQNRLKKKCSADAERRRCQVTAG